MKKLTLLIVASVGVVGLLGLYNMTNPSVANAATTANSKLSQTINPGVLSTDIRDSTNSLVNNPTFAMGATTVSSSLGSGTGVFGDNRIYAENPGAADNGWTLTLNVATPGTGVWSAGGGKQYKYNGTINEGRLTVNPSGGTVTPVIGAAAGITKGTSTTFSGTSPVTLMSASATASKVWAGYITNTSLAQTIPAGQAAGTYVLPMVKRIDILMSVYSFMCDIDIINIIDLQE